MESIPVQNQSIYADVSDAASLLEKEWRAEWDSNPRFLSAHEGLSAPVSDPIVGTRTQSLSPKPEPRTLQPFPVDQPQPLPPEDIDDLFADVIRRSR